MKVSEIRERLKAFPQNDMIELFIAAYKHLPKDRKEGVVDDLILHGVRGLHDKTANQKKAAQQVDFPSLAAEIKTFLDNAYAQNYLAPNRQVAKAERPKWRFHVMRYIKTLSSIQSDAPHFDDANELLAKLYEMTAYACNYYLFRTEDAFASIRMQQDDFYKLVASRLLEGDPSDASIKRVVQLATESGLSREIVNEDLYAKLIPLLRSTNLKRRAVKQIELLTKDYVGKHHDYEVGSRLEECVKLLLLLKITLKETEEGISYCYRLFRQQEKFNPENSLYLILKILDAYGQKDAWVRTYEKALGNNVRPRNYLRSRYDELVGAK
ncbi:hypothetical protein [uncultured Selenomonas sp.]|uniref:hypothetical protein n=1 Tax=uncultured Selenomonas sp. TaxID=159275 RepID=UPI0025F59C4C|nr:hypothetical protein [uncultured Selenomonas sp.]